MTETNRDSGHSQIRYSTKFDHLIEETRNVLCQRLRDENEDSYYKFDLNRAMEEDFRVRRFLLKSNGSVDSAVKSMITTFHWIKKYGLREAGMSQMFPIEVALLGSVFIYEPDLNGRKVLYMRYKYNNVIKEVYDMKTRIIAYILITADDESGEDGFSLVIDMLGISWSNLELGILSFFHQMSQNFPFSIALSLFVDLPFFCQATFNVFRYAFPPDVRPSVLAISRDQLSQYVDIKNIPPFLGGTCPVPFSGPSVVPKNSVHIIDVGRKLRI